jgi:hypothetical protein
MGLLRFIVMVNAPREEMHASRRTSRFHHVLPNRAISCELKRVSRARLLWTLNTTLAARSLAQCASDALYTREQVWSIFSTDADEEQWLLPKW